MLYLAQVCFNHASSQKELQLLAYQQGEQVWQVLEVQVIPLESEQHLGEGLLMLVELGKNKEILTLKPAKDWILALITQYLSEEAITPAFIRQETERIEQWRQEVTAQSLELTRRQLEIETHRDQLQELENTLKKEKEKLEALNAAYRANNPKEEN